MSFWLPTDKLTVREAGRALLDGERIYQASWSSEDRGFVELSPAGSIVDECGYLFDANLEEFLKCESNQNFPWYVRPRPMQPKQQPHAPDTLLLPERQHALLANTFDPYKPSPPLTAADLERSLMESFEPFIGKRIEHTPPEHPQCRCSAYDPRKVTVTIGGHEIKAVLDGDMVITESVPEEVFITGTISLEDDPLDVGEHGPSESLRSEYLEMQETCGLEIGDCVRVNQTAKIGDGGWIPEDMYPLAERGQFGIILDMDDTGISLAIIHPDMRWRTRAEAPCFALDKREVPKREGVPTPTGMIRNPIDGEDRWL